MRRFHIFEFLFRLLSHLLLQESHIESHFFHFDKWICLLLDNNHFLQGILRGRNHFCLLFILRYSLLNLTLPLIIFLQVLERWYGGFHFLNVGVKTYVLRVNFLGFVNSLFQVDDREVIWTAYGRCCTIIWRQSAPECRLVCRCLRFANREQRPLRFLEFSSDISALHYDLFSGKAWTLTSVAWFGRRFAIPPLGIIWTSSYYQWLVLIIWIWCLLCIWFWGYHIPFSILRGD